MTINDETHHYLFLHSDRYYRAVLIALMSSIIVAVSVIPVATIKHEIKSFYINI